MLDFSSLKSAINALERALSVTSHGVRWAAFDAVTQETLKAGVIQTFEVAYEQGWKMLKRWLDANPTSGEVEGVPMRQLYRVAAKAGLIDEVDGWMDFHKARNETSHTYNRQTAQAVFEMAPRYLIQAQRLLVALEQRND